MKIKSHLLYLLAALFIFGGFFIFSSPKAEAYTGPFNFTANSGASSATLQSPPPQPYIDLYNATAEGGQDMTDAVANAVQYLGTGQLCSTGGPTSTATANGWVTLTPQNVPNPLNDLEPGEYSTVTVSVNPTGLADGRYCALLDFSSASSANGASPANKISVTLLVGTGGTSCSIDSFTANPSSVSSGGSSVLSWTTSNCTNGTLNGGSINNLNVSASIVSGSQNTGAISTATTYTLNASGPVGSDSATVTVTIGGGCVAGNITFTVNGAASVSVSQNAPVTLAWSLPGACTSGQLTRLSGPNDIGLNVAANGTGSRAAQTTNVGTTVYRLTAQPGNVTIDRSVTVSAASTCVISSFIATPNTVTSGNSSTLSWTTSNCNYATLNGGSFVSKSENHQIASGSENTGSLSSTTVYTLLAGNDSGSTSKQATVTVGSGNPCTINTFTATPQLANQYQQVRLEWTTSNCTSGFLNGGDLSNVNVSSTIASGYRNTTAITAFRLSVTYTLTASGPLGSDQKQVLVSWNNSPCESAYTSFTANGATNISVTQGATVILEWVIPSSCDHAELWSTPTSGSGPYNGLFIDPVSTPTGSANASTAIVTPGTTYRLTLYDGTGGSETKTVDVAVTAQMTCTIVVNSFVNGSPGVPAPGFNFTIPGPTSGQNIVDSLSSSSTKSYTGRQAAYTYTATIPSGYSNPPNTFVNITPSNSQTCNPNSTITFNYNFTSVNPPEPPNPPPVSENSSLNATVACGQIRLTWSAATNATSYNIFRNTTNTLPGAPWQTGVTGTVYSDTSPVAGAYYWIQSVNSSGTSAAVVATNTPITATNCQVNLSTSGKVVTAVDGQPYSFSSSCIPGQTGTVKTITNNDVISFNMNVCNTGTIDATSVSISDDFTGMNLYNIRNVVITGGGSHSTAGNVTTFTLGTIGAGLKKTITFDADVIAPTGGTQTLYRFRNVGNLTYSSSGGTAQLGCVGTYATVANPCRLDTGYIPFYNGQGAPIIKEVSP